MDDDRDATYDPFVPLDCRSSKTRFRAKIPGDQSSGTYPLTLFYCKQELSALAALR